MVTNPAQQMEKRRRLIVVEELMLDGHRAATIFDMIGEQFGVVEGTIRNDMVAIRKAHAEEITKATELKGRREYLAKTKVLRRKANRASEIRITHDLDKEIAKIHGVNFKEDPKIIQLNIETARNEMDRVMQAVFSVVTDPDTQELIITAIEALATENLQIATVG